MQAVAERVDVEERKGEEKAIAIADLPTSQQVDRIGEEVVVCKDGAFRRAGGAGGVDDRGRCVAVEWDVWSRCIFACEEIVRVDDEFRFGVVRDVADLAIAIENVDRNEDHAELHAGEIEVDQLDAIGEIDAEAIAFLESARA